MTDIYDPKRKRASSPTAIFRVIISMSLCVGIGITFLCLSRGEDATVLQSKFSKLHGSNSKPLITCPRYDNIEKSLNDQADVSISEFYESDSENLNIDLGKTTMTMEKIEELKNSFDGWSRGYDDIKKFKTPWITTMFGSLKDGDTIFESACGRGLNLLMTAELLKEELDIKNLNVYGIEYVQSSVEIANQVLSIALPPLGSKLGSQICRADATNLFFIPDESFDLVYTGYIDPLTDPLSIEKHIGRDLEFEDLCDVSHPEENWAKSKLAQLDQKMQEDWYSSWVKELIRIAKRGKPVIVEEVSLPLCDNWGDWGGVKEEWWHEAVSRYGWDVDPESIRIEKQSRGDKGRYDVFMKKND